MENIVFDDQSRIDLVHIDEMVFKGRHGVGLEERAVPQDFKVEIVMGVDIRHAGATDVIEDTVNYQIVKDEIQRIVEAESYALIEKLAERIWNSISTDSRIRFAKISIRKLQIWKNGIPGVTVTRHTNSASVQA
jgi:dihydroneopterin aldolase